MKKIQIVIERDKRKLWGRVNYRGNLIVESSGNIPALEKKITRLLKEFHGVNDVAFERSYDLTVFFEHFDFLKQSKVAELAGINPALLRQYASGIKFPSLDQAKKIENAVHELAKELYSVSLSVA